LDSITEGAWNRPDETARQQFPLGQPILNQTGMDVDRTRQRDAVDRQFLIVDAISRQTGEQKLRYERDNKPMMKPSRTTRLLRNEELAKKDEGAFGDRRAGNRSKQMKANRAA